MMMEEEEDDDGWDEDECDFVPLIATDKMESKAVTKHTFTTKRSSFEILTPSIIPHHGLYHHYDPVTMRKAIAVIILCLVGMFLGGSLVHLGLSSRSHDKNELAPLLVPLETCEQRFNMTYDMLLQQVASLDYFCAPESRKCFCTSPFEPLRGPNADFSLRVRWNQTFDSNKAIIESLKDQSYDVVFFGDSITEHWNGNDLGYPQPQLSGIREVFQQNFIKDNGGTVDGVALGIGGDRCPQLLYRLRNGELPDTLDAKLFWILIGTNDFGGDHCSSDTIVAGNILIAQELLSRRPGSTVVINSILPRGMPGSDIFSDPSWPILTTVNEWLECFANENDRVEFFNATDVFLRPNTTSTDSQYYMDPVHPSTKGHSRWATRIVDKVLQLIQS